MKRNRSNKENPFILVIDIFCIVFSFLFASFTRNGIVDQQLLTPLYRNVLLLILLCYIIMYDFSKRNNENIYKRGFYKEFLIVLKNQISMILILMFYLFITRQSLSYSRYSFTVFFIINILFTFVSRSYFKLYMLLTYNKSFSSNKLMIITVEKCAKDIVKRMKSEYECNAQIKSIAIIDHDIIGKTIEGIEVQANHTNLLTIVKDQIIDEVFIHLPYMYQVDLQDKILELERMGIIVYINIGIYNNLKMQEKLIDNYMGFHVITYATNLYDRREMILKRFFDIVGGVLGIILMIILAIFFVPAIKIESKGPVFFSQIRIGKNGRRFKMYKFRSMYQDAEIKKIELINQNQMQGLMFKIKDDPRITKIGKFIRKTSIDEFPQFINVLRGDMSLVGTRPPTEDEYERYNTAHRRRLSIKPGITGLWQVSGRNRITDFEDVVKLDIEYIDNWTIGLDIKILIKTIAVVLFRIGAR